MQQISSLQKMTSVNFHIREIDIYGIVSKFKSFTWTGKKWLGGKFLKMTKKDLFQMWASQVISSNLIWTSGIIDYIRTFTWDKKLETLVKSTVLGSGQGPPTVVSPEVYRNRFLEAMDRYFLLVPDKWSSVSVVDQ